MERVALASVLLALLLAGSAAVRSEEKKKPPVSYAKEVLPFLKDHCFGCHSGKQPTHNLSFDTPELLMKGGDQGPPVRKGKSADSLMVMYLLGQRQPKMPPNERLEESSIELVRRWIDEGAKFDLPPKKDKKDGDKKEDAKK